MIRDSECLTFQEALKSLVDERAVVTSPVLYALSAPSLAEVQLFRRQWPSLPLPRRQTIVSVLAENGEANFELDFNDLFRVTLEDEDVQIRTSSVEGLWEDEEVDLVAPLARILREDQAMEVRAAAASSLGRFVLLGELEEIEPRYSGMALDALLQAVDSPEEHLEVRRRAMESIAYVGDEVVQGIIEDAYAHEDEAMRISAVFAMGRSADTVWSQIVQDELSSPNSAMRYEAARACGELELKDAVPALIRLVSDPDREVQFAAIASLGQIGGKKAREILERSCKTDDEVTRLAAEDALAELDLGQQSLDLLRSDLEMDVEGLEEEDEE
jgi:HEAT repeat protein